MRFGRCALLVAILWSYFGAAQASVRKGSEVEHHSSLDRSGSRLHQVLQGYKDNTALEEHLRDFTSPSRCGQISRLFSIGKSVHGTELWALEISSSPGKAEPKPNFKYVGNMHGDEPSGRVLQLALAEWLCENRKTDPKAKQLVENMKLYLLPTMNPDGFAEKTRENSKSVDLNRDFPDPFLLGKDKLNATGSEQPETLALMDWMLNTSFVASASMHEGAFVANYPWDGSADGGTHYSACPDDQAFIHLAKSYASLHGQMNVSREFEQGITNGAAWYPLWGGMQDWNYLAATCMELTLELSLNKWPPVEALPGLWEENRLSLLNLPITAVFGGLRGYVRGAARRGRGMKDMAQVGKLGDSHQLEGDPVRAVISVEGIDHNVYSSLPFGDFYRPLAPGAYNVTISALGFKPETVAIRVPGDNSGIVHNFTLVQDLAGHQLESKPHLPRKFGPFGEEMLSDHALVSEEEKQEVLISERMWISLMQTAAVAFLGIGGSIFLLMILRVVFRRGMSINLTLRNILRQCA